GQIEAALEVAPRDRGHEPQVRLDEARPGARGLVASALQAREGARLRSSRRRHASDDGVDVHAPEREAAELVHDRRCDLRRAWPPRTARAEVLHPAEACEARGARVLDARVRLELDDAANVDPPRVE